RRGGAGIGCAAESPNADSIDRLVRRWAGNKPPTKKELQEHQADLLRAARVLQAMAELAPFRQPAYDKGDKRIEEWRQVAGDFKAVPWELRQGIQQADAVQVRDTALKLNQTCNRCHNLVGI